MPITRFNIKSTSVDGDFGIVDVSINNATVASNMQLTSNYVMYEYETPTMLEGTNSITFSLLNAKANDNNNDGDYNDPDDETMKVTVSNIAVALDNTTFVEYLPTAPVNIYDQAGNISGVIPAKNDFLVWGQDYAFTFEIV